MLIKDSDLSEMSFLETKIKDLLLENVNLTRAEISNTIMKEINSKRLLYVPTKILMVGVKSAHNSLRFMVYKPCPTICDEGGTRTHDPQLRRLLLYPTELPHHLYLFPF